MRGVFLALFFVVGSGSAYSADSSPRILVLGDSLSAAYGIDKSKAWVALLQQRLLAQGYPHEVVNLSISGETTAGGLRRLPQALQRYQPDLVLLELGANDGLRAQPLDQMQKNLAQMIQLSQEQGAQVLLFEMRIPSNYGPRYTQAFRQKFQLLSEQMQVPLQPFFLADIAADDSAFQDDGIHPNEKVQGQLLDTVWPNIQALLALPEQTAAQR